jgi:NADPH:quinone reductase-like Zn-dependent oxidoreductase
VRERHPEGVDAVADLISTEPDVCVLKDGGRLVSPRGAAGEGRGRSNVMAKPSPANLERLGRLLDSGALTVSLQATYPLECAGEALKAFRSAHTQGKLGVQVA